MLGFFLDSSLLYMYAYSQRCLQCSLTVGECTLFIVQYSRVLVRMSCAQLCPISCLSTLATSVFRSPLCLLTRVKCPPLPCAHLCLISSVVSSTYLWLTSPVSSALFFPKPSCALCPTMSYLLSFALPHSVISSTYLCPTSTVSSALILSIVPAVPYMATMASSHGLAGPILHSVLYTHNIL